MDGFAERIFPIRIFVDPEAERLRINAVPNQEPFSYKRLTNHLCHSRVLPNPATSIQAFGCLVAVEIGDEQLCTVFAASTNTAAILGHTPEELFSLASFDAIVAENDRAAFEKRLRSSVKVIPGDLYENAPDVFQLSITSARGSQTYWCSTHNSKSRPNLVVCEFEPIEPNSNTTQRRPHSQPQKILAYKPSDEEWHASTTRKSVPIRSLPKLNSTTNPSSTHTSDLIGVVNEIQGQLISTTSIETLFGVAVGVVSEVTGFDRVMLYKFDECKCGAVVGEYVNPEASEDLFLGLHFPSSDLPQHTRLLYQKDPVQIMRNRTAERVSLVYKSRNDDQSEEELTAVDLTPSYLRDVSPEQVDFFSDLNVCSAMSISLIVENDLWGLITCHSYGDKIVSVSPLLREVCRNIGKCASNQIERLLTAQKLQDRIMIASGLSRKSPGAFITATSSGLLELFTSEFGILVVNDEARAIGKLGSYHEALALVQYFRTRGVTSIIASQKIAADFPDLKYDFSVIAGLLAVPLSSSGSDFMIVFRKQQLMEIHWAGNSQDKFELLGGGNVEPKASFQRWVEHVVNTSREWTTWQLEMAQILGTLYGTFTEIWRTNQVVAEKSRMKRLLISNASHEVRTPLNHIINNLEIAVDAKQDIDPVIHEHVEASLRASKSLLYVINDLLRLTKLENSDILMHEELFSLRSLLHQVIDAFTAEAERKGLRLSLKLDVTGLPAMIMGDPQRLRQTVSNILSNALESSNGGAILVSVRATRVAYTAAVKNILTITIKDEGKGMTEAKLDALFQQFEDILDEDLGSPTPTTRSVGIGLGLAVAARFVRNSRGQMRMRSKKDVGTEVILELPLNIGTAPKNPLPTPPTDTHPSTPNTPFPVPSSPISERAGRLSSLPLKTPESTTPYSPDGPFSDTQRDGPSPRTSYPFPTVTSAGYHSTIEPISSTIAVSPAYTVSPAFTISPGSTASPGGDANVNLNILVAEDNPLNAKVLRHQLFKMGHTVTVVGDGQACFDTFKATPNQFDVILMDFQMPLIDGPTSTKLIREYESKSTPTLSSLAMRHGCIPIFAVSASLQEEKYAEYVQNEFDGWILKPINFRRVGMLMMGIWDGEKRRECAYTPGEWENGGWFGPRINGNESRHC